MKLLNSTSLRTLGTGFKATFQRGLSNAPSQYQRIATVVPSSNSAEEYGWLGQVPGVREWIGDRVIQNLSAHSYTIRNRDFESTIGVQRNDIEDDNLGMYAPMFEELGRSVGTHKETLVWDLLSAGFATKCYDGQNFFDTDHPVLDANGQEVSVSNFGGGAGRAWYLIDDTRAIKPLILQVRKDFQFTALNSPDDPNVFHRKEFLYGYDARMNVGFGFWQFAYASKQPLDVAAYEAARAGMSGIRGDYGRPLGIQPKLLVVPPELEGAARRIVGNEFLANGESNPWKGTAEVLVVPWLS